MALGVVLVPVLLRLVGEIGTGLVALLGASVGLASIAQEIARDSMIRELGEAYHSKDPGVFTRVYNSSLVLCLAGGGLSTLLFGVVYLLLPYFTIPSELLAAVKVFLIAKACQGSFETAMSPQINMLLVYERMISFNLFQVAHRAMLLIGAGVVYLMPSAETISERIAMYGIATACLQSMCIVVAAALLMVTCTDLRPMPTHFNFTAIKSIARTSGWNLVMSIASRLHERGGSILMNIYFGPIGNLIFDSLSFRLASYVRMTASGMTTGVDAIAARISSSEGENKLYDFLVRSTHFHAIATFPAAIFVFVMAEPLLEAWVGRHVEDPDTVLPVATAVLRVLLIGICVRCISDGWLRIFYGAGYIGSYAPIVLAGGLIGPILSILLYWILPDEYKVLAIAISFSFLLFIFNGVLGPLRCCRQLNVPFFIILIPLLRPAIVALISGMGLVAAKRSLITWNLGWLLVTLLVFVGCYSLLTFLWVIDKTDRDRILKLVKRKRTRTNNGTLK